MVPKSSNPTRKTERKLFGTDGIRGVANKHPMTSEVAVRLGRALVLACQRNGGSSRPKIVIGKDTRLSGYMLETALTSGICSMGGEVWLVGPLPTPAIAFLTSSMRADAGVVISASHNPYQDNGIKIFGRDGFKLSDADEVFLEHLMESHDLETQQPDGGRIGQAFRLDDAWGRYVVELKHCFPRDLTLDGLDVVVDCANGAAYRSAPAVLRELGARVFALGVRPNGRNINLRCGSLHPEFAAAEVKRKGADIGFCLDGDADRLIVIDEKGQVVDGDAIMALCALRMLKEGTLAKRTLVATVMSNLGLDHALEKGGGKVVRTPVGDRYVVEEMQRRGCTLGGEQSGHLIFLEHASTGDGMVAALQTLAIMIREGKPLSALGRDVIHRIPQVHRTVTVRERKPIPSLPGVKKAIAEAERKLKGKGRVFVRYSGTELKARVLVEGPNEKEDTRLADRIADEFRKALG